ncbi:MAG: GNAT family N-acetyltransferase [Chloroflexi bacterium]|nr:GNAT family N-acetyltransferase [Chloroflexota bacterium]
MTPATAGWPAELRSRRLRLRARALDDPTPDWLPEAESALGGAGPPCPLGDRIEAGDAVYWLRPVGTATPVGACAARVEEDALVWTWLAVEAEWRGYGYGGAAVPIVERAARRLGATSGRALVPASNGIALYFWLRLGYRPLAGAAWAKPREGTWMGRALSARDR